MINFFYTHPYAADIYQGTQKNITNPSLKPRRWLSITQKPAAKATCLVWKIEGASRDKIRAFRNELLIGDVWEECTCIIAGPLLV